MKAIHVLLSLLLAPVAATQPGLDDPETVRGTWTAVRDGFTLTVTLEPDGEGLLLREVLDENNRCIREERFVLDSGERAWVPAGSKEPTYRRIVRAEDRTGLVLLRNTDDAPLPLRSVERPAPPTGRGRIAFISNRTGDWEIYTMAPDGSDVVNVTNDPGGDHYPNWIAGGTRLAFRSQRGVEGGGWDRWEIDADGTDAERAPVEERIAAPAGTFPEVHPRGTHLVYAHERDGEQDLYISRIDGGGERVLAPAPGLDYRPLWSPDGERVLFVSERDGDAEIYVVDADGSNLLRLTEDPGIDRYARWSPDGSWIVFASDREGQGLELLLVRPDGSELTRLTENDAEDGEPSWSPDGRHVVYRSNAGGNADICIVDVESGEITKLTDDAAYDGEPVWSPALP